MSADAGVISRETAAKLLMLTPRHIARLVSDGWIKKSVDDRYTVVGCVQGYINYLKDETRRNSQRSAVTEKDAARTREIELRIAMRERTLVGVDEAGAVVDAVIGAMRAEVDGLPARMRRDRALREELQKLLDGILIRAADRLDQEMRALRQGIAPFEAVEEDEPGPVVARQPRVSRVKRGARAK